jgi:hypothetical protein
MDASSAAAQDRLLELDGDRFPQDGGKSELIPAGGARAEVRRGPARFHQGTNAARDPSDDPQSARRFIVLGPVDPSLFNGSQKALEVAAESLEKLGLFLGALMAQLAEDLIAGGGIDAFPHDGHQIREAFAGEIELPLQHFGFGGGGRWLRLPALALSRERSQEPRRAAAAGAGGAQFHKVIAFHVTLLEWSAMVISFSITIE